MSEVKITDNVPLQEPPKKKTRARKSIKKQKPNPAAGLLEAIKFISIAQKKAGPVGLQFCHIAHNWAAASDGILTVANKIEEELSACPNTMQLIDALSKVSEEVSITQLNLNCLAVSSGAFRGLIPCVSFEEVPIYPPDPKIAIIDDKIKFALSSVAMLATENAHNAAYGAILLQAKTAVATNGSAILECWHGIDLPPGIMLPKIAAVAVSKSPKALTGFGFSQSSATFYFEDDSFIKTQLYAERFPNYLSLLEQDGLNPWPIPDEFYKAIRTIEPFSEGGNVYFEEGFIYSNIEKDQASTYKIEGLPEKTGFNAKQLLLVEHAFKSVHFMTEPPAAFFFGENIRGLLMGLDLGYKTEYNTEQESGSWNGNTDEDVPF